MGARYRVVHAIAYRFAQPIAGAKLELRLEPSSGDGQIIHHHQLVIEPRPRESSTREDAAGNRVQLVELSAGTRALQISSITKLELEPEGERLDAVAELDAALAAAGVAFTRARRASAGLCRERTEAAIAALEAASYRCRYVAGYALSAATRRTLPHAWLAVALPRSGWLEYDPTLAAPARSHVRVAVGRGYDDVAPVSGHVAASGEFRLVSTVDVEALDA